MLGIEVNLQTGAVRLNLGHSTIPLTPNFSDVGFERISHKHVSLFQATQSRLNQISDTLWQEFDIKEYKRVRPLLPIPYLTVLGDTPPVVILDHEPVLFNTREPKALGFTDFKGVLGRTNLLPLIVDAKVLRGANRGLKDLARLPRERPLIMVLNDEDTLPIHGQYLKTLVRHPEMTSLHELSLLKFWALKFYEVINFGEREELDELIRLEGQAFKRRTRVE